MVGESDQEIRGMWVNQSASSVWQGIIWDRNWLYNREIESCVGDERALNRVRNQRVSWTSKLL